MKLTSAELLKRVRKLQIRTRSKANRLLAGNYQSRFHGRGMSFSEVREYVPGDDVKAIDWNVTARMQTPYVKVFEEERELSVMLVVDVSPSARFGTGEKTKEEVFAEIAASLMMAAEGAGDRTGLLLFSDRVETYLPPRRGRRHSMQILRALVDAEEKSGNAPRPTIISGALQFLSRVQRRRNIVFLLSDFDTPPFDSELSALGSRHDVVGIRVWDEGERTLPAGGLFPVTDAESGTVQWIDAGDKATRVAYTKAFDARAAYADALFRHCGVPLLSIPTTGDAALILQNFFQRA